MRILLVLGCLAGCSFFSGPAPTKLPVDRPHFGCDLVSPVVDTVVGVPTIALGGAYLVAAASTGEAAFGSALAVLFGSAFLVIGGVYLASASSGWNERARCKGLMEAPAHDWALAFAAYGEKLAGDGDCKSAMEIGARAAEYEPAVYTKDFLYRPAIVKCRDEGSARHAGEAGEARRKQRVIDAMDLAKRSREAARSGDCAAALADDARIKDLDSEIHETWFAHDPDVARCLAP